MFLWLSLGEKNLSCLKYSWCSRCHNLLYWVLASCLMHRVTTGQHKFAIHQNRVKFWTCFHIHFWIKHKLSPIFHTKQCLQTMLAPSSMWQQLMRLGMCECTYNHVVKLSILASRILWSKCQIFCLMYILYLSVLCDRHNVKRDP